jgi:hypothetical protein
MNKGFNVSSYRDDVLSVSISDRNLLIDIGNGKVRELLILIDSSRVLYDEHSMFKDGFCDTKCDTMTIKQFREHYKKHFDSVVFTYIQYFGDVPERRTMKNPDWDIAEIPGYFKLTWEFNDA